MITKFKEKTGFTLIEALVAISILMIAIVSPMTMAQKSLVSSMLARDQMIASFLAQDALEGIKNARDQIAMNGDASSTTPWLGGESSAGLYKCFCSGENCNFDKEVVDSCNIDTTKSIDGEDNYIKSFTSKGSISPMYAYYNNDGKFKTFSLNTGSQTKFKRAINIEEGPNGDTNEARVQVRVFWDSPFGEEKVDLVLYIYNYEPKFK